MTTLQVLIASTRPGRMGLPVGRWVADEAIAHGAFKVNLVDLAEVGLPLLDEPHHPKLGEYVHQHTVDWSRQVDAADAFVFVTPEYNHGPAASLLNAISFLFREWQYKPVGFVSYGGASGGIRGVEAMQPVLSRLSMVALHDGVALPYIKRHVSDGVFVPSVAQRDSAGRMLDEVARWSEALLPLRTSPS